MKTLKLTPETKINALLVVDKKKTKNVIISQDMNMTLLEWTMRFSFSNQALIFGVLPNFLNMKFKYDCDGSNNTHKMSCYVYEDNNYLVSVNVFDK